MTPKGISYGLLPKVIEEWRRSPLGENIRGVQGVPIMYLQPGQVKQIAGELDRISADDLEPYWDPKAMYEFGVYKIHAEEDRRRLDWLKEDFDNLKNFYQWAAIYEEGVLVLCD